MNILRKIGFLVLSVTIFSLPGGYSQEQVESVSTESGPVTNYYQQFTSGLSFALYRDFATSPLFYKGYGVHLLNARLKRSDLRERSFEVDFGFNSLSAHIPESNYIQPYVGSMLFQLNLRYLRLWKLNSLSNQKNNVKLGGNIYITQNFRNNPSLQNNSLGLENISNLMVTGQITRDISRKEARKLNLWLFKPTLKPVKRDLRFQFNAGILNFNYRPGYAYSYNEELEGTKTTLLSEVFSGYKWTLNGWRLNTELEYITYLPNGNARSWSYVWDAANAPGRHEAFQMASHQIRYTYYFQTKKR